VRGLVSTARSHVQLLIRLTRTLLKPAPPLAFHSALGLKARLIISQYCRRVSAQQSCELNGCSATHGVRGVGLDVGHDDRCGIGAASHVSKSYASATQTAHMPPPVPDIS
jgi:hypothetical protein